MTCHKIIIINSIGDICLININSLELSYSNDGFRLSIPHLVINKSEKVAIIGPSGSGKTSLLKLISGILVPQKGKVSIDSVCVNLLSESKRRDYRITNIGFIFQDFELLDYLDVQDNILHPFRITRALRLDKQVRCRAKSLAKELGIDKKMKRITNTLSQGEKQRTAICRAMLSKPKLILADEATGNLDPGNKTRILDALFRSTDKDNATLIAVTHDHELLYRFDRVIDFKDFCVSDAI
jgi:putative ABC transport system ATP-binding protein